MGKTWGFALTCLLLSQPSVRSVRLQPDPVTVRLKADTTYLITQTAAVSEEAKRFIGTWRLVSDTQTGLMIYDNLGNMAAQVMPNRVRPKYAGAQPTPDEAKQAITGYLAYFGTYTVDERARTIAHHRKANLNPGQIGDDAVRRYEFATPYRVAAVRDRGFDNHRTSRPPKSI